MTATCTIHLELEPQPEGGFTVTSPTVPGLVTEGDTVDEAIANAWDALTALIDAYVYLGRPLPTGMDAGLPREAVRFDWHVVAA